MLSSYEDSYGVIKSYEVMNGKLVLTKIDFVAT
jgi:hypothetical protein